MSVWSDPWDPEYLLFDKSVELVKTWDQRQFFPLHLDTICIFRSEKISLLSSKRAWSSSKLFARWLPLNIILKPQKILSWSKLLVYLISVDPLWGPCLDVVSRSITLLAHIQKSGFHGCPTQRSYGQYSTLQKKGSLHSFFTGLWGKFPNNLVKKKEDL